MKPQLDSVAHYFDQQHQFFTKMDVHFNHQRKQLRAILLFPFHQKGHFVLDSVEVYYDNKWVTKRGNLDQYGMALIKHPAVILLGQQMAHLEQGAKNQLDDRFHELVKKLASRIQDELSSFYHLNCQVSPDSMSILTTFEINGEEFEGIIETNFYFNSTMDDGQVMEQLLTNYKNQIVSNIERMKLVRVESKEPQKTFITTIPVLNPVSSEENEHEFIHVSIFAEGSCENCKKTVNQYIKSNLKIKLQDSEKHKLDLLITVLDDQFVCERCHNIVLKEKVIIQERDSGKRVVERSLDDLLFLGYMNDQQSLKSTVMNALEHVDYFQEKQQAFWDAYTYIAVAKWDSYIEELTKKELQYMIQYEGLELPAKASKAELLTLVRKINLSEEQKKALWRGVNEAVIRHYLFITIFGWDMKKESEIIGINRASFIFQYIPVPQSLHWIRQKLIGYFAHVSENATQTILHLQTQYQTHKQQIHSLQQENGRLSQRLGEANKRISMLEQASYRTSFERNKEDIIKIHGLKGLVEELKAEVARLSTFIPDAEESKESVQLTEKKNEQKDENVEEILTGKNILILGGYRSKGHIETNGYHVYTHEARNLDPQYYEYLNKADMIIILTRYISHHAMWEAKEYAILEQKSIFYSTFTNIPTILKEAAREYIKIIGKKV